MTEREFFCDDCGEEFDFYENDEGEIICEYCKSTNWEYNEDYEE